MGKVISKAGAYAVVFRMGLYRCVNRCSGKEIASGDLFTCNRKLRELTASGIGGGIA